MKLHQAVRYLLYDIVVLIQVLQDALQTITYIPSTITFINIQHINNTHQSVNEH